MKIQTIIILVGSILIGGSVFAKPPEEICDPIKELTNGLYGLCVAFCGNHPSGDLGTLELSKPQLSLLQAYNRIRGDDDPTMPCFKGCPCFTTDEAELVATHSDFLQCHNFLDEETGEQDQEIEVLGDIDANGHAQTKANVSAALSFPEPEVALAACQWVYLNDVSSIYIGKEWTGNYLDTEDRRKYEDCQDVIYHIFEQYQLPCESEPECLRRIATESPNIEDLFVEMDGHLVNDPLETCVNKNQIARVDWYWGDGSFESFNVTAGGFVDPFPNSHIYEDHGFYAVFIYAYDNDGIMISFTTRLLILLG